MIIVFIALLLSTSNTFAVPPSNMVLIDSLEQIDNLNEPPSRNCQRTAYDRPVQGFTGTVSCNIKCKGQGESVIEVDNTFTNRDMNLRPGDGGLHASFNVSLDLWLDSICLQVGNRQCGPSNLETTKLKSLTSGNWKYDGPVYCPTIEEAQRIGNQRENIKEVLPDFKPLRHPFEKELTGLRFTFEVTKACPAAPFTVVGAPLARGISCDAVGFVREATCKTESIFGNPGSQQPLFNFLQSHVSLMRIGDSTRSHAERRNECRPRRLIAFSSYAAFVPGVPNGYATVDGLPTLRAVARPSTTRSC